jgi:hypothetical protein
MIEFRPNGLNASDAETVIGRIVMSGGLVIGHEYSKPVRVRAVSGKSLQVQELKRILDRATNRRIITDEVDQDSGYATLQMRTAKLICDTAAEVNAIRQLQEVISDEHTAFVKAIPARFRELAAKLAPGDDPKGPVV